MAACLNLRRSLETGLSCGYWCIDSLFSPTIGGASQGARCATSSGGMGIALLRA
jgi:hypothetical protein